jgi:hypothetical protein
MEANSMFFSLMISLDIHGYFLSKTNLMCLACLLNPNVWLKTFSLLKSNNSKQMGVVNIFQTPSPIFYPLMGYSIESPAHTLLNKIELLKGNIGIL